MRSRDNGVHWSGGGEPPGGEQLETRIAAVEARVDNLADRMTVLERDVAVIRSDWATKADVAEAKNSVTTWVVSALLLACGAARIRRAPED